MSGAATTPGLIVETDPRAEDIRRLDDQLYAFHIQATGIADGKLLALFVRDGDGSALGGYTAGPGARPATSGNCSFRPACAGEGTDAG